VIDIRTEGEWKETGVIVGSRLLTFFDENGRSNPPQWLEKLKPIAKPERPVILVCRSGNRTRAAAQFLSEQAGYKTVYNASQGIKAWASDARPMVPPSSSMAVCAPGTRC
jgi:rhodanese-related sulfurtransferase